LAVLVIIAGLFIILSTVLYPPSRCGAAGCSPVPLSSLYGFYYVVGGVFVLLGIVGLLQSTSAKGR
jgi:hypothetical protein